MRRESDEEIKGNYILSSLESKVEYDQGEIEDLRKFIEKVKAQIEVVKSTKFKPHVYLKRQDYYKPIQYYVGVNIIPEIEDLKGKIFPSEKCKRFVGGQHKKEVFEYAQELAKEYNCEIIKEGFKEKEIPE